MSAAPGCIVTGLANPESAWFDWSNWTRPIPTLINPIIYAERAIGFAMKPIPREALLARKDFLPYQRRKGEKDKRFTAQTFLG